MERALSELSDGQSRARVRPDCWIIARRLRWLWIVGLTVTWGGMALFSIGMIGYCQALDLRVSNGDLVHGPSYGLIILVPIAIGVFLFGGGITTVALLAESAVRAWLFQFKQLLFVGTVVGIIVVVLTVFMQPRISIRGLTPNRTTPGLSFNAAVEFELPPLLLTFWGGGMRIGDSSFRGWWSRWDEPALLGLPAALLCLPWAFFWPVRPCEDSTRTRGTRSSRPDGACVARRLRRLIWLAALLLPAALTLELMWLVVFVYRGQVARAAARSISVAALYWAGSVVSLSAGMILAALVGLYISRSWRFGLRTIAIATAALGVCFGIMRYSLANWLTLKNGVVWLVAHYERPPELWIADGMSSATLVRLPVIEPFSWFGPHSLLLVAVPFLVLPVIWKWPTRVRFA